jgi:hypothetical protein
MAVRGDPLRGVRSRLAGISMRERTSSDPPSIEAHAVEDRVTPLSGTDDRDALSDLFAMSEPDAMEQRKKKSEELDIGSLLFPTDPDSH